MGLQVVFFENFTVCLQGSCEDVTVPIDFAPVIAHAYRLFLSIGEVTDAALAECLHLGGVAHEGAG